MSYDPATYWAARGKVFETRHAPEAHDDLHDRTLRDTFASLDWASVIDVGCGWGRSARIVLGLRPATTYLGIDISPDLAESAGRWFDIETLAGDIRTLDVTGMGADLVIAIALLMHVPAADIEAVVVKLKGMARRHLVVMDWDEPGDHPAGTYQTVHDYDALFPGARKTRLATSVMRVWQP